MIYMYVFFVFCLCVLYDNSKTIFPPIDTSVARGIYIYKYHLVFKG